MPKTSSGFPVDIDSVLLAESVDAGSLEAMRGRVRELGRRCGLDDLRLAKFVLVVHELVVNAVCHGGGSAEAVVWTDAVGLRCSVTDHGSGIPRRYLDHSRSVPEGEVPRYGLRLVRQICPDAQLNTARHGTYVEIGYPTGPAS
jgi:anti-sigma regulatory factor (Ser/Thr protein kinase)